MKRSVCNLFGEDSPEKEDWGFSGRSKGVGSSSSAWDKLQGARGEFGTRRRSQGPSSTVTAATTTTKDDGGQEADEPMPLLLSAGPVKASGWSRVLEEKRQEFVPSDLPRRVQVSRPPNPTGPNNEGESEIPVLRDAGYSSTPSYSRKVTEWQNLADLPASNLQYNSQASDIENEVPVLSQQGCRDSSTPSLSTWGSVDEKQKEFNLISSSSATCSMEIGEFESPKKNVEETRNFQLDQSTEQWCLNSDGSMLRRRRRIGDEFKAIADEYRLKLKTLPQDFYLKRLDERLSVVLVVRDVCGTNEKVMWTICRLVDTNEDKCVVFPKSTDIEAGVVLKIYKPWSEMSLNRLQKSIIISTDFYRIAQKRDNNFGVSDEMLEELSSNPAPSKSSYSSVEVNADLQTALHSLVSHQLSNPCTVMKQLRACKPCIDLTAVVYEIAVSSNRSTEVLFLLKDSDGMFSVLQNPCADNMKNRMLLEALKPGRFLSFRRLGVNKKTTVLQNASLFSVLRALNALQTVYYTLKLRHDTIWEMEVELDIPYFPIGPDTCPKKYIREIYAVEPLLDLRVSLKCIVRMNSATNPLDVRSRYIEVMDELGDIICISLNGYGNQSKSYEEIFLPGNLVIFDFLRIFKGTATLDEFSSVRVEKSSNSTENLTKNNMTLKTFFR